MPTRPQRVLAGSRRPLSKSELNAFNHVVQSKMSANPVPSRAPLRPPTTSATVEKLAGHIRDRLAMSELSPNDGASVPAAPAIKSLEPTTQEQPRVSKFTEELDNEDEVDSHEIPRTCGKDGPSGHTIQKTSSKSKSPPPETPDSTLILSPIQPHHLSKPRLYEPPEVGTDGGIDHHITAVPPTRDHPSLVPTAKRTVRRPQYMSTFDLEYDTVSQYQDLNIKKRKVAINSSTGLPSPPSRSTSPPPLFNFHTIAEDDGGRPHLALALDHMRSTSQELHNPTQTRRQTPKDPREGRRNGYKSTLFPYPFYPPELPSSKTARLAASKATMKVIIARETVGLLAKLPPDDPTTPLALEEILGSSRLMNAATADLSTIRTAESKHRNKGPVLVQWTLAAFRKVWDGSKTWPRDVQVDALSERVVAVYEQRYGKGSLPKCGSCVPLAAVKHELGHETGKMHEAQPQHKSVSADEDKPSHQSPTDSGHGFSDSGSSVTVVPSSPLDTKVSSAEQHVGVAPNVCDAAAQQVLADLDKALARFREALMLAQSIPGREVGTAGSEAENGDEQEEEEEEEL